MGLSEWPRPEMRWGAVCPLWHIDYWDGPISGFAMVDGQILYFRSLDPDRRYRTFHLFAVTDEEWRMEQAHHDSFVRRVGAHTNYSDGSWRRQHPPLLMDNWHDWYDDGTRPPSPDYKAVTARTPVGFFTRSPHGRRPRSKRYWEQRNRGQVKGEQQ